MRFEVIKIIIIAITLTVINFTRPCPTYLGYKLIKESKISASDLSKLDLKKALDFKTSAGINVQN